MRGVGRGPGGGEAPGTRAPQARRGLFAQGRSDPFRQDVPYASLAQALQGLLRQILCQDDFQIERWRESLQRVLDSSGQLLVDLIPELALIIGANACPHFSVWNMDDSTFSSTLDVQDVGSLNHWTVRGCDVVGLNNSGYGASSGVYMATHDLRNPINSIYTGIQLLGMKLTPDEIAQLRATDPDLPPPSLPAGALRERDEE